VPVQQEANMCILGEIDKPNVIQPKTAEAVLQVLISI